jgi:hypothetical protein
MNLDQHHQDLMDWTLVDDRFLQSHNDTEGEDRTEAPVASPNMQGENFSTKSDDGLFSDKEGIVRFGIILLAAAVVVCAFLCWRSFESWKLRRERYMLQVQSSRADAVLGDMQMVPNHDDDEYDDDDPELL